MYGHIPVLMLMRVYEATFCHSAYTKCHVNGMKLNRIDLSWHSNALNKAKSVFIKKQVVEVKGLRD